MGVVYKLTEDVINYIIRQKQKNPRISVRTLANVVHDHFQIKVSKSSVNSVLQAVDLSSSVGRRPLLGKKPAKFQIPAQRKKQLFASPEKPSKPKQKKQLSRQKVKAAPVSPKRRPPSAAEVRKKVSEKSVPKTVQPKSVKPIDKIQKMSKLKSPEDVVGVKDKGVLYDGMGSFFLKAAEWELSSSEDSILGGLLKEHIKGVPPQDINAACETLLYCDIFGIHNLSDMQGYENKGIWFLSGSKTKLSPELITKVEKGIDDADSLVLEMSSERNLIFAETSYITIVLEDNTEYYIDAQFSTIWTDNVQSESLSLPNDRVLSNLTKKIINNLEPAIFCSAPGSTAFTEELYTMMASFENLSGKKIVKIILMNEDDREIVQFDTIPTQRRSFIIGLWPWQEEFQAFLQERGPDKKVKQFFHELLGKAVFFTAVGSNDLQAHFKQHVSSIRVFFIQESEEGEVVGGVMTNIAESDMTAEEVISAYLLRWPNLQRGHNLLLINREKGATREKEANKQPYDIEEDMANSFGEPFSLWVHAAKFLTNMDHYCRRRFFPFHYEKIDINSMISRCYGLPGYLKQEPEALRIRLVVPKEGYRYREDLEFAIKRLAESEVRDKNGRRLFIKIDN